jgi:hypothetical protein
MDSDTYYLKKYLKYKIKYLTYKNNNLVGGVLKNNNLIGGDLNDIMKILLNIIIRINNHTANDDESKSDLILNLFIFELPSIFDNEIFISFCKLIYCIICNYLRPGSAYTTGINTAITSIDSIITEQQTDLYHLLQKLLSNIPCYEEFKHIILNYSQTLLLNVNYDINRFKNKFDLFVGEACRVCQNIITKEIEHLEIEIKNDISAIKVEFAKDAIIIKQELERDFDIVKSKIQQIKDHSGAEIIRDKHILEEQLQHITKLKTKVEKSVAEFGDSAVANLGCMFSTFVDLNKALCCADHRGGFIENINKIIKNTMRIIDKIESYDDNLLYNYLNIKIKNHNIVIDQIIKILLFCIHLIRILKNIFKNINDNTIYDLLIYIDKMLLLIFFIKCKTTEIVLIKTYFTHLIENIKSHSVPNKDIKIIIINIFKLLLSGTCDTEHVE